MKRLILILIIVTTLPSMAQQSITLEECYSLVAQNYPLAKQSQLLEAQNKLDTEIITNAKLPQLSLDVQATYQSDVIEIPIPDSSIEPLNNDQYRATVSINQLIYGGGIIDASLNVKSTALKTKQKQIEVNLYQLKKQVNQLYFSILLTQEKRDLLIEKEKQLNAKLKEVKSGIKNGVLLPTSDEILQAELLKVKQQFSEIDLNKMSLINTLSSLIGKKINSTSQFKNQLVSTQFSNDISRPELELFQLKKDQIEASEAVISKENSPKLLGFANGGYGNPGLNMLDNSFQSFYTVGVKLNWNVFDWNTNKTRRKSLSINKDVIDNETEIFKLNTNIKLNQQQKDIEKMEIFITSDEAIIKLRKEVLQTADSQLKNDVITSSAYITELTNLYEEENTLVRHKIQLQLAKANYNVIKGK